MCERCLEFDASNRPDVSDLIRWTDNFSLNEAERRWDEKISAYLKKGGRLPGILLRSAGGDSMYNSLAHAGGAGHSSAVHGECTEEHLSGPAVSDEIEEEFFPEILQRKGVLSVRVSDGSSRGGAYDPRNRRTNALVHSAIIAAVAILLTFLAVGSFIHLSRGGAQLLVPPEVLEPEIFPSVILPAPSAQPSSSDSDDHFLAPVSQAPGVPVLSPGNPASASSRPSAPPAASTSSRPSAPSAASTSSRPSAPPAASKRPPKPPVSPVLFPGKPDNPPRTDGVVPPLGPNGPDLPGTSGTPADDSLDHDYPETGASAQVTLTSALNRLTDPDPRKRDLAPMVDFLLHVVRSLDDLEDRFKVSTTLKTSSIYVRKLCKFLEDLSAAADVPQARVRDEWLEALLLAEKRLFVACWSICYCLLRISASGVRKIDSLFADVSRGSTSVCIICSAVGVDKIITKLFVAVREDNQCSRCRLSAFPLTLCICGGLSVQYVCVGVVRGGVVLL